MYLADYHTHSQCSFDSEEPLMNEAAQALNIGLSELCTTDHFDMLSEEGQRVEELDFAPMVRQYEEVKAAYEGRLKLRLGLELGEADINPGRARKILAGCPLDFVLGSVHNQSEAAGGRDLFYLDYSSCEKCYAVLDDYFASMARLVRTEGCFDILAHIIYPIRYMKPADGAVTLDRYEERLRDILTTVADSGLGIELNTYCGRTVGEWLPVLKLYRECGGEVVTLGSDAHAAENIGKGIAQGHELLREAGFRYQAVYQKRRPQFKKL